MQHDLTLVGLMTRGPSGTIWLTQPQDGTIVAFTSSGEKLQAIGRRGEGPGEFSMPAGLRADSSGLHVFDGFLRRVTRFDLKGRLVGTQRFEIPEMIAGRTLPRSVGVESIGYLMVEPMPAGQLPALSEAILYVADLSGSNVRELFKYRHPNCAAVKRVGNNSSAVAVPFCHQEQFGFSPNGKFAALALPTTERGTTTGFALSLKDLQGSEDTTSRHSLGPNPIPQRLIDSVENQLRMRDERRNRDLAQLIIRSGRIPGSFPPLRGVAVSDSGSVWVTTRSGPTGALGVLVIGRDGAEVGYAPLPPKVLSIGWVSERQALALQETPDGLYDVVLYTIGPE